MNTSFATHGTQLYSSNNQVLPNSSPISVAIGSDHLLAIFQEADIKLISMPLNSQDSHYQILNIGLEGHIVQRNK